MRGTMPTPQQLAAIDDEELERLATAWRAQASRGDQSAFGLAHALEVELRKRQRESRLATLAPESVAPRRPWWKFW